MQTEKILAQLYCRERGKLVPQSKAIVTDEIDYQHWLSGKRAFTISDVADSHWIKTCTEGYVTEVVFHSGGLLNEYRLFDRFKTTGSWQLVDGLLHVEITKGDNTYRFAVVGNAEVNIHSAVEHKNDDLHAYLKLSQVLPKHGEA